VSSAQFLARNTGPATSLELLYAAAQIVHEIELPETVRLSGTRPIEQVCPMAFDERVERRTVEVTGSDVWRGTELHHLEDESIGERLRVATKRA
jgi:hypothetical protein